MTTSIDLPPADDEDTPDARPSRAGELLSGVDALIRLLGIRRRLDLRQGLDTATMVSGYPGSPLGTFDLALDATKKTFEELAIVHQPGLNEELAAATVWGSQMGAVVEYSNVDGVAGVWYGKTPGLDRSGDVIRHGNSFGTGRNGGLVMFCGDDPTAKSSTLSCDSQYTFEDACMPVLFPADQQDVIDLGVHAFRLSRYAGCWVGFKVVTAVADGIGTVDLDLDRHHPTDPTDFTVDGRPWRHEPQRTVGSNAIPNQEVLVYEHRLAAAKAYAVANGIDRVQGEPGARLGIVCAGKTYLDVVQALGTLGVTLDNLSDAGVRILKLGMTYPVVEQTVLDFAGSVEEIVVVEEKRPFVEAQVRAILHESGSPVRVVGKRDREGKVLTSSVGDLDAAAIATVLRRVMPSLQPVATAPTKIKLPLLELAPRAPGYCSGCPHNRSTVFPDEALVGGGVGCHGIMYFEARHRGMKAMPPTPMGAEGVPWVGLAPFVDEPHLIQNLGDGTLSHSGTLAIRASVAAGVNITFKVLYNTAVAMTGGQDVTGLMDVPSLTRSLEAEGVSKVVVCAAEPGRYGRKARWAKGVEVYGRDHLEEVQAQLREVPGVTVLIYDQRCAAEARRLRKRGLLEEPPQRVFINEAVCEGCGDCGAKSNCLSVLPLDTEFGEKRQIHDPSCNRDYTCLEGDCPSFVTVTPKVGSGTPKPSTATKPAATTARVGLPGGALPEPPVRTVDRQYGVFFTGIGGTGVVTANRILATAAEESGFYVGGMDQTGLSQKAGAVSSHLHWAADRRDLGSATISTGGADLYLSGDILQAASEKNLDKVATGRTIAVVDRDFTPTAAMLQTDTPPPDVSTLEERIASQVGAANAAFVDSTRIAEKLIGNHMLANVVLIGAAYQLGGLPLPLDYLDEAMRAGRSGADTRLAFDWGRWAVHDRDAVETALALAEQGVTGPASITDPSSDALRKADAAMAGRRLPAALTPLLHRRAAQVIDYQDAALADRFLDLVDRAAATDDDDHEWKFTRAVAEAWFKLLTYKDEYEVARLHLKVDYDKVAADLGIEGDYSIKYHLHPPTLRRMGLDKKLPMGKPYDVAFRALRKMRRLRGTPFDIFGYDPDRRMERALIEEYQGLIDELVSPGSASDYEARLEVASSAMNIKGYGPIKEAAVDRWHSQLGDLRRRFGSFTRTKA